MTDSLFRESLPPIPDPEPTPPAEPLWRDSLPPVESDPPPEETGPLWRGDGPLPEADPVAVAGGETSGGDPDSAPPVEAPTAPDSTAGESPADTVVAVNDSLDDASQAVPLAGLIDDVAIAFGPRVAVQPAPPPEPVSGPAMSPSQVFEQEDGLDGNSSYGTAATDLFALWFDWEAGLSPIRKLPPDWLDL